MNSHLQLQHDETTLFYVVGAGITGCVIAERIATLFGRRVVVFEKRPFVGGNSYADIDAETGIEIHRYGSHIFHTTDERVWRYVNRFTSFNSYRHKVLLRSKGRVYSMPVNLKTVNAVRNWISDNSNSLNGRVPRFSGFCSLNAGAIGSAAVFATPPAF